MSQLPLPSFAEIVLKALCHEIFERYVSHSSSNSAYYVQQTSKSVGAKKGKNWPPTSSSSSTNSKSSSTVHYQLWDKNGHLAKRCWSFLKLKKKQSANIAKEFSACSIQDLNYSKWFPDSGVTSHMTSDTEVVDQPALYSGNERVMVGNGQSLAISHTGSISSLILSSSLLLSNVLVVLGIKKNLISISQLTKDNNYLVTFSSSGLPYRIRSQELYWESEDVKTVSTCWIVVIMPLCPPLLLHREPLFVYGMLALVIPIIVLSLLFLDYDIFLVVINW